MTETRPASDSSIASEQFESEGKSFSIDLQENARGRVFTVMEENRGRRNRIMLPTQAAREFLHAIQRIADFESKL